MEQDNIYKTPSAELLDSDSQEGRRAFFSTSKPKLLVLFIATFGSYSVYWFYKHWEYRKRYFGEDVIPILRGVFYIFFIHSLFERIRSSALVNSIEVGFSLGLMATVYLLLDIASRILDKVSQRTDEIGFLDFASMAIVFLLVIPPYMAQGVANRINQDPDGLINCRFSFYNYLFIIPGAALWLFIVAAYSGVAVSPIFEFLA